MGENGNQCWSHNMVVTEASTCPKCGKADFRKLACTNEGCSHTQTDTGSCQGH